MVKDIDPKNVYELIENDNGEMMVLLFADDKAPQNSTFCLNETKKVLELYRNKDNTVSIEGLKTETMKKIKNLDKIYVCELKYNEDENAENEIIYAYAANLKKVTPRKQTASKATKA